MKRKQSIPITIARSGYYSIENAKKLIGYQPKYSTRETVEISIQSYIDKGVITIEYNKT